MTESRLTCSARSAVMLTTCLVGLAGCATSVLPVHDVDGRPCLTFRKTHRPNRICAAAPAPAAEVERQVKRFEPDAGSAQLLVHWRERGGVTQPLRLWLDGRAVGELVPGGLVRLRVAPGPHQLAVSWHEGRAALPLATSAGELQFAEVSPRPALWAAAFGWDLPALDAARQRATHARLTADLDLRPGRAADGGSVIVSP